MIILRQGLLKKAD